MTPPLFCDIGKNCRDLFTKGYHFGIFHLESKLKPEQGPEFLANVVYEPDRVKMTGFVECKVEHKDYGKKFGYSIFCNNYNLWPGVTIKERWCTVNNLTFEIGVQDKLAKGLKLSIDSSIQPPSHFLPTHLHAKYLHEAFTVNGNVNLTTDNPVFTAATVGHYKGWLLGYQATVHLRKLQLYKSQIAIGYEANNFSVHSQMNDARELMSSIYVKNNPLLQTGVQMAFSATGEVPQFGIGCIYQVDDLTSVRAKLNNQVQLGMGLSHKLKPGAILTLSMQVDIRHLNFGNHKVGIGLQFEA